MVNLSTFITDIELFCTQDYKEFIDAENLMPLATSDFRNPICLEMKLLRSGGGRGMEGGVGVVDMGSVDSSDTYASCNTQPFNSQVINLMKVTPV